MDPKAVSSDPGPLNYILQLLDASPRIQLIGGSQSKKPSVLLVWGFEYRYKTHSHEENQTLAQTKVSWQPSALQTSEVSLSFLAHVALSFWRDSIPHQDITLEKYILYPGTSLSTCVLHSPNGAWQWKLRNGQALVRWCPKKCCKGVGCLISKAFICFSFSLQ
jgi:hypothetical protein